MFVFSMVLLAAPMAGAQGRDNGTTAQAAAPAGPRMVLLVYSEHGMPRDAWTALFEALRRNLPEAAAKVPAEDANPEFVRGSDSASGDAAGEAITVFLRGDCVAPFRRMPFPGGERLGWVSRVDGVVLPIIHVECTQIGEEISGRTQDMNQQDRTAAMSEAIARVILHEWVHVATQSDRHASEGITKATFSANDLLCGDPQRRDAILQAQ